MPALKLFCSLLFSSPAGNSVPPMSRGQLVNINNKKLTDLSLIKARVVDKSKMYTPFVIIFFYQNSQKNG